MYQKSWWYDLQFLRYRVWQMEIGNYVLFFALLIIVWCMLLEIWSTTECFIILGLFLLFYPSNNWKNQNFEKMTKTHGDIIILQLCNLNDNDIMYHCWDEHSRQDFLWFWTIFCPFTHPNNPENQNFVKVKKSSWRHHEFTQVYHKW